MCPAEIQARLPGLILSVGAPDLKITPGPGGATINIWRTRASGIIRPPHCVRLSARVHDMGGSSRRNHVRLHAQPRDAWLPVWILALHARAHGHAGCPSWDHGVPRVVLVLGTVSCRRPVRVRWAGSGLTTSWAHRTPPSRPGWLIGCARGTPVARYLHSRWPQTPRPCGLARA